MHQGASTGFDHTENGHAQALGREFGLQFVHGQGGRGGVARNHDGLGTEVSHQAPRQFTGVRAHVGGVLVAVRVAARVADVDDVLVGQQVDDRARHGEATEAGVEQTDRSGDVGGGVHVAEATRNPVILLPLAFDAMNPPPSMNPEPSTVGA